MIRAPTGLLIVVTVLGIVMSVLGNLNSRTDGTKMAGLSTGIVRLDEETGGIRKGGYWVIAGPTKGGKSALVRYIVRAVALDQAKPVLVFGLEMSSDDTVEAMLATEGKVSASRMRDGTMHEMDFPKLTAAANNLALAPIFFRDDVYDLAGIRSYVRQVKAIQPDLAVGKLLRSDLASLRCALVAIALVQLDASLGVVLDSIAVVSVAVLEFSLDLRAAHC